MWFIGIGLIVLITFLLLLSDHYQDELDDNKLESFNDLAIVLQDELLLAAQVHDGYERSFEIPEKIENIPIEIITFNELNTTVINFESQNISFRIPPNTQGQFLTGTKNTITNKDNSITLNP